jgi:hypothetical protein
LPLVRRARSGPRRGRVKSTPLQNASKTLPWEKNMASVTTRNARRIVQFVAPDGQRYTVTLGRMTERNARLFAASLDRLLAARRAVGRGH